MVKQLSKVGNSHGIILDKAIMELVGLQPGGQVNVQVNGSMICLSALPPREVAPAEFKAILDRVVLDHGDVLRKLAQ